MQETEVDIETRDGSMNTFITRPDDDGPWPLILFLMDAPGKREELHDMARRIATVGYYVMLPNLYYRTAREFTPDGSRENREVMFSHMNSLTNELVVSDCRALLEFATDDDHARSGSTAVIGYCMSGPFAFAAAAHLADRVTAAASIHGVRLCTDAPDSPHLDAGRIRGELYFGCAETDDWAPPEMIERLGEHLDEAGSHYRIEWYPGTEHGFVFPDRAGKYDKAAAERHWERLFALFARNL